VHAGENHAVFTGGVYFGFEDVCSYRLQQVDSEGFVEQYPVTSVTAKYTIQQFVKKWWCTGSVKK
jgi:hypothetical protein